MPEISLDTSLLVLPYHETGPAFAAPAAGAGRMSAVVGRVTIGRDVRLGDYTIIRADGHFVRIGDGFALGSGSTVHIAHDMYPTIIGDRVTVGRDAVIHACTVGDDCVIEDGAVVLDGSVLEAGVVLEAGSVVYPRSRLEAAHVYGGRPAKALRAASSDERRQSAERLRAAEEAGPPFRAPWAGEREHRGKVAGDAFIAATARVRGEIDLAPSTSIWFACDVDVGNHALVVGEKSNIQDNTVIRCEGCPLVMGAEAVIGHNVKLAGCTLGDGSLIGIGSVIAEGTVVDPGVLVAAGTQTEPGQHLEAGWLWGGTPARALSRMNDDRRALISGTIRTYVEYAQTFAGAQRSLGR